MVLTVSLLSVTAELALLSIPKLIGQSNHSLLTATAYDTDVNQLFDRVQQLHAVLTSAGIRYRVFIC